MLRYLGLPLLIMSYPFFAWCSSVSHQSSGNSKESIDLLSMLGADNSIQISLHQDNVSSDICPDNNKNCNKSVTSVSARFEQIHLSNGAKLEIYSPLDGVLYTFNANDINNRSDNAFKTPSIQGKNITLRITYPPGMVPDEKDTAILARQLITTNDVYSKESYIHPDVYKELTKKPSVCMKGLQDQNELWARSLSVGYNAGTVWLAGKGNTLFTNYHNLNDNWFPPKHTPDFIRFNYESPDCNNNHEASSRNNNINIRVGKIIKSGGASSPREKDWILFSLDDLEYQEAGIKKIFGGIPLNSETPVNGATFYVIGHGADVASFSGSSAADPNRGTAKRISTHYYTNPFYDIENPSPLELKPCQVTVSIPNDTGFNGDCDFTAGSSGSPVISESGQSLGMYMIAGRFGNNASWFSSRYLLEQLDAAWDNEKDGEKPVLTEGVTGKGHVRTLTVAFPAFKQLQQFTFLGKGVKFSGVARDLSHKPDYSQITSYARDNYGNKTPVIFRLSQTNDCGSTNLESNCQHGEKTTLNIWIDKDDNSQIITEGNSVQGWLPIEVADNNGLIANQVLHYSYKNYEAQHSPFNNQGSIIKFEINNNQQFLHIFNKQNHRSGMTAIREGEGPVFDNPSAKSDEDNTPYAGMTPLNVDVLNKETGQHYSLRLRGGIVNSCTKLVTPVNNWTPMNSSGCKQIQAGTTEFTDGSIYLLQGDNKHLPKGKYTGLLPLMIRNWDAPEHSEPVEIHVNYEVE